ncbi:hypothetical protein Emag_006361 [Eimeria magna]
MVIMDAPKPMISGNICFDQILAAHGKEGKHQRQKNTYRSDSSSPCSKLCRLSGPELLLLAAVETPPPAAARAAATVEGGKQQQRKQKLMGSGSCRFGVVRAAAPAARLEERPTPSAATATAPTARGPAPGSVERQASHTRIRNSYFDFCEILGDVFSRALVPAAPAASVAAAAAAFGLGGAAAGAAAAAGPDPAAGLGDIKRSWRLRKLPLLSLLRLCCWWCL